MAPDAIRHVIALILENHSFDQMLGDFKQIYPDLEGVDRKSPKSNSNGRGQTIYQKEMRETQTIHDPYHETVDVLKQLSNNNGGFICDFLDHYSGATVEEQEAIMGFYPLGFLPALHTLARSFTICDHWYSCLPGPTWPNRFFALSGTSMGKVKMPENNKDFGMLSSQTQDTIFDRLDEKGVSWNIFYYDFPCSLILKRQREFSKRPKYRPVKQFFDLCEGPEINFPQFALIEPKYDGFDQNDDHPPHNTMKTQKLIADVYNALRSNDTLWANSLLVVFYDEHGGFYDHMVPPDTVPPDERNDEYTFDKLGVRVPALLVSPFAKKGVEKTQFEHTSLLKYLSEKWNLDYLSKRVEASTSIGVSLCQQARHDDTPRFIRVPFSDLASEHPGWELIDLSKHQVSIMAALEQLISNIDGIDVEEMGLDVGGPLIGSYYRFKAKIGGLLVSIGRKFISGHSNRRKKLIAVATKKLLEEKTNAK